MKGSPWTPRALVVLFLCVMVFSGMAMHSLASTAAAAGQDIEEEISRMKARLALLQEEKAKAEANSVKPDKVGPSDTVCDGGECSVPDFHPLNADEEVASDHESNGGRVHHSEALDQDAHVRSKTPSTRTHEENEEADEEGGEDEADVLDEDSVLPSLFHSGTQFHHLNFLDSTMVDLRLPRRSGRDKKSKKLTRRTPSIPGILLIATRRDGDDSDPSLVFVSTTGKVQSTHALRPDMREAGLEDTSIVPTHVRTTFGRTVQQHYAFVALSDGSALVYRIGAWFESGKRDSSSPIAIRVRLALDAVVHSPPALPDPIHDPVLPEEIASEIEEIIEGGLKPDRSTDDGEESATANKATEKSQSTQQKVNEVLESFRKRAQAPAYITSVTSYSKKKHHLWVAGYNNGIVRVFSKNGTVRNEVHTGNSTVTDISMSDGDHVAFATEAGFGLVRIHRARRMGLYFCPVDTVGRVEG